MKRLAPAIVGISVKPADAAQPPAAPAASDPGLHPATLFDAKGLSIGSGTLVSADGLVMTSCSLLSRPGEVTVHLDGDRKLAASIVGVDKRSCVALLKVALTNAPFVKVAPVQGLAAGERVIALGRTALGSHSQVTVTEGLVSAVFDGADFIAAVQSTVMVLPPMGGGPLVRLRTGEVVGINAERYVSRENLLQSTFSIPVATYLRVEGDLRTQGRVDRAVIGIKGAPLTAEQASALNIPGGKGVLLVETLDKGAAQAAGLQRGDIILEADGRAVARMEELMAMLADKHAGEAVRLKVWRLGSSFEAQVTTTRLGD
ncbi:S1C family serine protease [Ideonella sp. YS5]|uniref:S1C family serine protease n=1 Tax=Ideonella sp. YS5 TaxID=3453714 RepID=UPI003EE86A5A